MSLLVLLLACKPPKAPTDTAPPSVETLWEAYIESSGEMPDHDARRLDQKFQLPAQGIEGVLTMWQTRTPEQILTVTELPGLGELREGFDGEVGWANDQMNGPRFLDADQLNAMRFSSSFEGDLNWEERYRDLTVVGSETFHEANSWKMEGQVILLDTPITLWFDAQTGLLSGIKLKIPTMMGKINTTLSFEEYTDFGGYRMPKTTRSNVLGMDQLVILENIELDPEPLPDFSPPESVRALLQEDAP